MRKTTTLATTALALALATLTACGGSNPAPATAASPSTTPASTQAAAAPTDAPSTSECAQFAQVYNQQLGPALKATGTPGSNVVWTTQADAFHALTAVLDTGADPYSQTLGHDAAAVEASDRAYDADGAGYQLLGTFNADLQDFLKQCGMSGNSR